MKVEARKISEVLITVPQYIGRETEVERYFQVLPTFIVCILDGYVAPFKFRVKREAVELDVCVFVILISR